MKKLFVLAAALSMAALAQDSKPNFSGAWELVVDKCDFGQAPESGPRFPDRIDARTDVVDHKDPSLKVTIKAKTPQGDMTQERNWMTNGQEVTEDLQGSPLKSRTRWVGKELLTESTLASDHGEAKIVIRWQLSDNGKTLTTVRSIKSDSGEMKQTLVFVKKS